MRVLTGIRVIAMALSFAGLCGLFRRWFRLPGTSAPLAASCGIIVLLMLGGMAGALEAAWWLAFAGGLAGFAWCYLLRRRPVDWMTAALVALTFAYGYWLLGHGWFSESDTVSHWGMVVKYMLRTNAFPDASMELIWYPSYPLGAAVFIWYVCRMTLWREGMVLAAQFYLAVIALLPMLGLVRRNRGFGYALLALTALFLLNCNTPFTSLRVDGLIGFMGIGGTAMALQNRERPYRAALLVAVALVFVKSSGIFFGIMIALCLLRAVRASGGSWGKLALGAAGMLAGAFLLWELHVKLAYPGGLSTRHAVSLENYSSMFQGKSPALIRQVIRRMLSRLAHPDRVRGGLLIAGAALLAAIAGCMLRRPGERRAWLPRLGRLVAGLVAAYGLWYLMLIALYLFSMPAEEAEGLMSLSRYERTMLIWLTGVAAMFAVSYFCREDFAFTRAGYAAALCGVLALGGVLNVVSGTASTAARRMLRQAEEKPAPFAGLLTLLEEADIEEGKSYLLSGRNDIRPLYLTQYMAKYEFFSNDIMLIIGGIEREGYDADGYYTFNNTYMHNSEIRKADDLKQVLADNIDDYDYLLVCDPDPRFEDALKEFLKDYAGDTRVFRAY